MMIQLEVEVCIRKGLGPDFIAKNFPVAYDDLPEETTHDEIYQIAKFDVEQVLYKSEDFKEYGKNWEITGYHFT